MSLPCAVMLIGNIVMLVAIAARVIQRHQPTVKPLDRVGLLERIQSLPQICPSLLDVVPRSL